jgi:sulfatase maturation enzyme AslB (radical SAM superfamily)
VNKEQLLKKLETAIDEAARQRMYGNIEIEFRGGEPVFIRKMQQEKLDETENRHGSAYRR